MYENTDNPDVKAKKGEKIKEAEALIELYEKELETAKREFPAVEQELSAKSKRLDEMDPIMNFADKTAR